ncbi:MAG: 7-carboxy-7-deazaguanine synthase [Alphaproteobacteria bacterium]|nr:MAG: 7-carboxy-7-deazaguanine synthase [Alphaproteobacteria bacterium]
MTYSVKECFYTLQGEGAQAGRPAVFLRFAGCNLWNGLERDRASAICQFCDTDFVGVDGDGGGKFKTAHDLARHVERIWPPNVMGRPYVVCTGGEPLMQLDEALIDELHRSGFEVAVETNGTLEAPEGIDWICVSPKAGAAWVQRSGNEIKLVYPQAALDPSDLDAGDFDHWFLQPLDNEAQVENTQAAARFCLENPKWKLSLQIHKLIGLP